MTKDEFAARLKNACAAVIAAEAELTEIDSKFGDADHGLTMAKIAHAVTAAVEESGGGIQTMLDDAAMAVMSLNGGSAVPLWNSWLDGMQEDAPEADEIDLAGIKAIFARAFEEIDDMSGAKVGDKTMMDALIPATEAIAAYEGDSVDELFSAAAEAAAGGAEASKQFVSKFGRAKSYGAKTIGTPDAGAVSMACFFRGLAKA
ncbi:MAG: DAK2 domain-containing protein [Candidatus Onthomonas sp.]